MITVGSDWCDQVTPLQDFSYSAVNVSGIGGITTLLHFDYGLGGILGLYLDCFLDWLYSELNDVRMCDTWLCMDCTGP